jgi:hypothetical protein
VSSWALVANVSGFVAVAASLLAVIVVIALVLVRTALSGSSSTSQRHARPSSQAHTKSSRINPISEVDLGLPIRVPAHLAHSGERSVEREEPTVDPPVISILLREGDASRRRLGGWPFRRKLIGPVIKLPIVSAAWSDVLRSAARGLEEQADIIAQQQGSSDS